MTPISIIVYTVIGVMISNLFIGIIEEVGRKIQDRAVQEKLDKLAKAMGHDKAARCPKCGTFFIDVDNGSKEGAF